MTWQRIDEDTYIDDTLVTCAEYQLFIDEMREQGMFYQPDHWASYQFSEGQAREPILGIRHTDAVAFCEWLTQREAGEWCYRLPIQKETREFSLPFATQSPLGYWMESDANFSWIGPVPINVRALDTDNGLGLDIKLDRALALDANRNRNIELAIERAIGRASANSVYLEFDPELGPELASNIVGNFVTDLVNFKERIAGRSPAFEGIRLVKERIR